MQTVVEVNHFDTAEEFLATIRLSNGMWDTHPGTKWIFRGHRSADWELLPSTWRKPEEQSEEFAKLRDTISGVLDDEFLKIVGDRNFGDLHIARIAERRGIQPVRESLRLLYSTVFAEHHMMHFFTRLANDVGLHAGIIDRHLQLPVLFQYVKQELYVPEIKPAQRYFALAQHHGIPTRLIDWTKRPEHAALFACMGKRECDLAIWALRTDVTSDVVKHCRIHFFECPTEGNGYLHAQLGVFTYIQNGKYWLLENGQWPCLDEILKETSCPHPIVRKLVLPQEQVHRLFGMLWKERVTLAHLMPSYDGISRTAREYWGMFAGLS